MSVVVIGGNSRNVGKSSVVAGLIRAMPELGWLAVKITQYGHGICSANGEFCDCATASHAAAVSVERSADSGADTSRFVAAGAHRVLWVRTEQGHLAEAMPRLRKELAQAEHAILESNSVIRFLRADTYIAVLDPANPDFKASAQTFLDRADALLVTSPAPLGELWSGVPRSLLSRVPVFHSQAPEYVQPDLVKFVRERIPQAAARL